MKTFLGVVCLSALLVAAPVTAQTAAPMSDGEVRKVDKSAGKVTIKHERLQNLDMPAMTMVFRVKDPAMLKQVKIGDKVKFEADVSADGIVVTRLQKSK